MNETTQSSVIKIEKKYLEEIKKIQESYQNLIQSLGKVELKLIDLEDLKKAIKKEINDLRSYENQILKEVEIKHGKGQIEIETGEFKPTPEEELNTTQILNPQQEL